MFIWFSLGFVGSIVGLYQLSEWPSSLWLIPVLHGWFVAHYAQLNRIGHFSAGVIIGWIVLSLAVFFNPPLPEKIFAQPIWIEAEIVGLVENRTATSDVIAMQRFEVKLQRVYSADQQTYQAWWPQPRIRLSCYRCDWQPEAGDVWRMAVRLKPLHGSINPGGFDYEAWTHQQGLKAQGYIVQLEQAQRLEQRFSLSMLRESLAKRWQALWQDSEFVGLYKALLYADKQEITPEHWEVLRKTGTIHLMAISGLHLVLVALIGFAFGRVVWLLPVKRFETWPMQWFGAAGALVFASGYAMLAGFSIPTQRAWLMVLVGVVFLLLRRKFQPWPVLMLAAFVVVAWQPASVLAQGFWLSFLAVGLIFLWLSQPWAQRLSAWQQMLAIQLVLSIGLIPALWWFYQQIPLYSVVANLIAVPFVSFIGLPLLLFTAILHLFSPSLAAWIMPMMDGLWLGLWTFLVWVASWPQAYWSLYPLAFWQVVLLYIALFSAVLLKGLALRLAALTLLVLILFWPNTPQRPAPSELWLSVLDVGQGQALVLETAQHVLVYDAGPKWGAKFDAAQIAITPYLRSRGIKHIDMLMISHADQDHAGGAVSLMNDWSIKQALTGQPQRLNLAKFIACEANQAWWWDGVKFEVLAPGLFKVNDHNDHSCVLRVSIGEQALMISGDLSARHEKQLIQHYPPERLRAQLVIAGHHGSKHSTHQAWLQTLQAELVLFSAGYENRFGFPQSQVIERVEQQGARWLNTACDGAIQIKMTALDWQQMALARQQQRRWFHHQCSVKQDSVKTYLDNAE